jgi:hypothetical protein
MSQVLEHVTQDVDAHLSWGIDWEDWLTARGYLADGSQVESVTWAITPAGPTITHTLLSSAISKAWIDGVLTAGTKYTLEATIQMPEPTGGQPKVIDQRSIEITATA